MEKRGHARHLQRRQGGLIGTLEEFREYKNGTPGAGLQKNLQKTAPYINKRGGVWKGSKLGGFPPGVFKKPKKG